MDAVDVRMAMARLFSVKSESGKTIASANPVNAPAIAGAMASTPAAAELQRQIDTRSELDVNQTVERVISRVVDESGTVINQIPSETGLQFLERSREVARALFNRTA